MTQLHRYLSRLYDIIVSRQEIAILSLEITDRSENINQPSEFHALVGFPDGSQLQINEKLVVEGYVLLKTRYAYHYQKSDGSLGFRYDNAPHHREIPTYPHHKHEAEHILPSQPPDLGDVLREIDAILYHGE